MGSKTDILVKLVLVFFISLLSFAVGTFVGKKFSDNQHQLAELEGAKPGHSAKESGHREVASAKEEHGKAGADSKDDMSEEEIAKLAEEFVADDTKGEVAEGQGSKEHAQSEHGEKSNHAKGNHEEKGLSSHGKKNEKSQAHSSSEEHGDSSDHKAVAKSEKHEASKETSKQGHSKHEIARHEDSKHETESHREVEKVEKVDKTKRVPASLPKNTTQFNVGKFTVQVASYASEEEAIKYTTDLKKKGFNAYYLSADVSGKTWYRVSVGQFTTVDEAKTFRKELMEKAHFESAIVQKIAR